MEHECRLECVEPRRRPEGSESRTGCVDVVPPLGGQGWVICRDEGDSEVSASPRGVGRRLPLVIEPDRLAQARDRARGLSLVARQQTGGPVPVCPESHLARLIGRVVPEEVEKHLHRCVISRVPGHLEEDGPQQRVVVRETHQLVVLHEFVHGPGDQLLGILGCDPQGQRCTAEGTVPHVRLGQFRLRPLNRRH